MNNDSRIAGVISEITSALSLYPVVMRFLSNEKARLDRIEERIRSQQTHIAIIGITSSGKSTLMNAVLGKDLLPMRVAPTSGKQVICGWDDTLHAKIIFEPGSRKPDENLTARIKEKMSLYGDEYYNRGNKERVSEMQVFSPYFRFNHDLVFIDTPGLDAYKLEEHERITLQLVLPTVDMVMYLTTVKSDSDGRNLEFLEQVMSARKPLIVVQNKIDSIEPKISSKGRGKDKIEKTRDEVRQEHLERLQGLLSKSGNPTIRTAPIVQVSAREKWENSNLESLNEVLNRQIAENSNFRAGLLMQQIDDVLDDMIGNLESALGDAKAAQERHEKRLVRQRRCKEHLDSLREAVDAMTTGMDSLANSLESDYNSLINELKRLYWRNGEWERPNSLSSEVKGKKNSFAASLSNITAKFIEHFNTIQARLEVSCQDFHLNVTDIMRRPVFNSTSVSIPDFQETRTIHHEGYRRKQEGFWGWAKRTFTFGHCGYEDVPGYDETITETNIERLVESIAGAFKSKRAFLNDKYTSCLSSIETALQRIENEYDIQNRESEGKPSSELPLREGSVVLERMRVIKKGMTKAVGTASAIINVKSPKMERPIERLVSARYNGLVLHTVDLAKQRCLDAHRRIMSKIAERSGKREIVVAGWARDRIDYFLETFFHDRSKVSVLDFSSRRPLGRTGEILLVLLVNAEQSGTAEKRIFEDKGVLSFLKNVVLNGKIVWVMDSVKALVQSGTFIEGFAEMLRIAGAVQEKTPVFDVMACERELYYTVLLHELNLWHGNSQNDKQRFVDEFKRVFSLNVERSDMTGNYLNQFIGTRTSNNGQRI